MEQKRLNSGVYKIVNKVNHKIYVGSSVNLRVRKSGHFSDLKKNKHHSQHLQKAYNKYGNENFMFEVIEYVEDANNLLSREQYWIDNLCACERDIGYNIAKCAGASFRGRKFSDETKEKMSKSRKGKKVSQETRLKISESTKGSKNHNYKLKGINSPLYKRVFSEESRKKMSLSHMGLHVGDKNGNYGRTFSEEHRKKISEVRRKLGVARGENNPKSKLNENDVREIKYLLSLNVKILEIASKYNVNRSTISDIKFNRRWQFVNKEQLV